MRARVILRATTCAICLLPVSAFAQESQEPDAAVVDEIVVTAQRRAESAQRTAIAITAISGEDAEAKSQNTLEDVIRHVPGLITGGQATGANVYVRGVGSNAQASIGDPGIAINIDGVYSSANQTALSSQFDVARVEVLRGPQGTLYGRNTIGGTINVLSNDPVHRFDTAGRIQAGNYDLVRLDGMINLPVGSKFALRAVGNYETRDGFLSNGGNNLGSWAGRVKALYDASPDVRALATWEHREVDASLRNTVTGRDTPSFFFSITGDPYNPDNPWSSNYPKSTDTINSDSLKLQLDANLGFGDLTVLPSYTHLATYSASAIVVRNQINETPQIGTETQKTLEIRLASRAGSDIKWVVGLYGLNTEFTDNLQRIEDVDPGEYTQRVYRRPVQSRSAFGQVTLPVSRTFRLTGGLRYNIDTKKNEYQIIRVADPTATPAVSAYDSGVITYRETFRSLTYKAGVELDVAEDSMLYGQVATGYKSGGIGNSVPPIEYKPEKLTAFELGSKNRFLGGRLQLNVEGYYYRYKDYQYQVANALSTQCVGGLCQSFTNFLVFNAAGISENYGAEAEVRFKPTKHDEIAFNLAYMKTKIGTAFLPDNCVDTDDDDIAETCTPGGEITGQAMANSPEWSGYVSYRRDFPLASGANLNIGLDLKLSDSYFTTPETALPNARQRSYERFDAYFGYRSPNGKFEANIYGKNLTKAIVYTWQLPLGRAFIGDPRTYGISLAFRY